MTHELGPERVAQGTDEALRQSEARFRLMANSAPVLIWMTDQSRASTWFNTSWLEFVGHTMDEQVRRGWLSEVHQQDVERCRDTYMRHVTARLPFSIEYRLRRFDGEYRWLLDHGVPMFAGPDSTFSGYMGTCIDITDRRRSEALLAESEAKFRQLAEDRTRLLEFERSVRRDAEEANRLKDEFLATLSHELRTPLNAIVGWTTILKEVTLPPSVLAEGVATIERNARMQSQLIEDLLDVSRISRASCVWTCSPWTWRRLSTRPSPRCSRPVTPRKSVFIVCCRRKAQR